jgi:ribose 1,5-bisphosphokinase PhnN
MMSGARGKLILVVGPSGGGEDALLSEAKQRLADEPHIEFAQRVITTAVTADGEMHVEMGAPTSSENEARADLEGPGSRTVLAMGSPRVSS